MSTRDESATRAVHPAFAFGLDVVVLVIFVLIGRRTHHEDAGFGGFVRVLWPFVTGLALGWLVTRAWQAPLEWRRAVPVWLVTVVAGIMLRVGVQGHAFKASFTVVALVFTGLGMLGWRAVARTVRRRSAAPRPAR